MRQYKWPKCKRIICDALGQNTKQARKIAPGLFVFLHIIHQRYFANTILIVFVYSPAVKRQRYTPLEKWDALNDTE